MHHDLPKIFVLYRPFGGTMTRAWRSYKYYAATMIPIAKYYLRNS